MPTASMMIVVMEALPKPSPSWLLALPASQQHHFSRLWATKRLSTHRKQGAFLLRPRSVREALVNGDVTKVSPPLLEEKSQKLNYDDPDQWTTLPDIWKSISTKYGDAIALVDPHHEPHTELTFKQLEKQILKFAEGLRQTGVSSSDKIALFADNSYRWLIADQGIMSIGAIDVVRGSRSSINELAFIYSHSDRFTNISNVQASQGGSRRDGGKKPWRGSVTPFGPAYLHLEKQVLAAPSAHGMTAELLTSPGQALHLIPSSTERGATLLSSLLMYFIY